MVLLATVCLSGNVVAQSISVNSGASFAVGDGSVDVGCGDLAISGSVAVGSGAFSRLRNVAIVTGSLSLGTGSLAFSGSWANSGSFSAGSGQVTLVDDCGTGTSVMSGDTRFHDFSAVTASGRVLQLAAGSTQTFASSLTLQGSGANPLTIRSSSPGMSTFFVLPEGGSQNIVGVDVADNNADGGQTLAPVAPEDVDSIDAGNNSNWFIAMLPEIIAKPVATLPLPALLLLSALLVALSGRFLRTTRTIEPSIP